MAASQRLGDTLIDSTGPWCAWCLHYLAPRTPLERHLQPVIRRPIEVSDALQPFLARWRVVGHSDCDRLLSLADDRDAIESDTRRQLMASEPALDNAARLLHERGMYSLAATLKRRLGSHLLAGGATADEILRTFEYALASRAGLVPDAHLDLMGPLSPRLRRIALRRPRVQLYVASRFANLGFQRRARAALRRADTALNALPGHSRDDLLADYWIRHAQIVRDNRAVSNALAATSGDRYRNTTVKVLAGFVFFDAGAPNLARDHFEHLLSLPDGLSWRYRAECWFGIACAALAARDDLHLAYRYLVAAQYVNAFLSTIGTPHPNAHPLALPTGRLAPTAVLLNDVRFRRLDRHVRLYLRRESILRSRLQRDLLWDLAGRIRRPVDPGGTSDMATNSEFCSCFISHSSGDRTFVNQLTNDLSTQGVRFSIADHDMRTGDRIRVAIDRLIEEHDRFLLVISRRSIASQWVEKEVEKALELERRTHRHLLVPIRLDNDVLRDAEGWPADLRRARTIADFRGWRDAQRYSDAIRRLLRDLRRNDLV